MYFTYYRDGLGFPVLPIAMGASALVGLFKGKPSQEKMTPERAKSLVRQISLEILEREPDYPGMQPYVDCLVKREDRSLGDARFGAGTCNVDDLRTNMLQSDEYRNLQQKKAAIAYGVDPATVASSGDAAVLSPALASPLAGLGPYAPYILGGVVLLMLLRR